MKGLEIGMGLSRRVSFPLPPDELRTNRRMGGHWGPVNDAKQKYGLACRADIRAAGLTSPGPGAFPLHIWLIVYLGKGQRADPSDVGSWMKGAFDCLVTEEVLPGDSSAAINPFTVEVRRDWERPRLEIWW